MIHLALWVASVLFLGGIGLTLLILILRPILAPLDHWLATRRRD